VVEGKEGEPNIPVSVMSQMYFERTSNKNIQIFYLILHEIFGNPPY